MFHVVSRRVRVAAAYLTPQLTDLAFVGRVFGPGGPHLKMRPTPTQVSSGLKPSSGLTSQTTVSYSCLNMRTIRFAVLALLAVAGGVAYYFYSKPPSSLVLTGIVTTND